MDVELKIIEFLQANISPGWITFFQFVTMFGSYLGFFITFIILYIKKRNLSYALAIAFVVSSIINHFLKLIIAKDRPFVNNEQIKNYGNEDGYSMPSGHSLCAGIFATYLFYFILQTYKKLSYRICGGIFLSLFAILIAFSRMVLGVHYLSDVFLGLILGILFAIISILLYNLTIKSFKRKLK